MDNRGKTWDAFVSHAVEDQESFVRELAAMLTRLGLSIWYAESALQIGDSLSASISKGLANSRYGIVVISPQFIAKKWTNWELAGLVIRPNSEEQNVILPIWHKVTKEEVMAFSLPLVDLWAIDTATQNADEIALQLLHRIRPDIYNRTERAQLQRLASGETVNELQAEIELAREELERLKEELAEYRCPHCGAPLASRNEAPLDPSERDWDEVESFACGYTVFGGEIQNPCPTDPRFPAFGEFELRFQEVKGDTLWEWSCFAVGKTRMARMLSLTRGLGRTKEEAAARVKESYDRYAKPWR
jgi:hypothetical protein